MRVRDAVEADAERMSAIADTPSDVMRNLVHDRTVRVAEAESGDADPNVDVGAEEEGAASFPGDPANAELLGFVSFDVRDGRVHVTQIDGSEDALERLLAEPVQFARSEGMEVELLVPEDEAETQVRSAADAVGFSEVGNGPRFEGVPTTRFRLKP